MGYHEAFDLALPNGDVLISSSLPLLFVYEEYLSLIKQALRSVPPPEKQGILSLRLLIIRERNSSRPLHW